MAVWRALSAALLASVAWRPEAATCPGEVSVSGFGLAAVVPTGWLSHPRGAAVDVRDGSRVTSYLGSRAYFADACEAGVYNHSQYLALNLLGRTLRYKADISGLGCGCNAAFYLTSMRQNAHESECSDYYCDANDVCGESCAEIDVQEANERAWHSTLHTATDHSGLGMGYGGGGPGWSGPRDWSAADYGPGARCVDTTRPFEVAVSFPVDWQCQLVAMQVTLTQEGHDCPLSVNIANYPGVGELSAALRAGMTPIVSYWNADDMLWMDGQGQDSQGPCQSDTPAACGNATSFYDFSVEVMEGGECSGPLTSQRPVVPPAPTAAPAPAPTWSSTFLWPAVVAAAVVMGLAAVAARVCARSRASQALLPAEAAGRVEAAGEPRGPPEAEGLHRGRPSSAALLTLASEGSHAV